MDEYCVSSEAYLQDVNEGESFANKFAPKDQDIDEQYSSEWFESKPVREREREKVSHEYSRH